MGQVCQSNYNLILIHNPLFGSLGWPVALAGTSLGSVPTASLPRPVPLPSSSLGPQAASGGLTQGDVDDIISVSNGVCEYWVAARQHTVWAVWGT